MSDETRIIERHPETVPEQRWDGYLKEDPQEQARHWYGAYPETVEHMMNADLGALPAGQQYRVIEGGGRPPKE
jgi:hypothetical protein